MVILSNNHLWHCNTILDYYFLDSDRIGKRQYGGLPKRCVYLRNTASDGEVPVLQWINIDEVCGYIFCSQNVNHQSDFWIFKVLSPVNVVKITFATMPYMYIVLQWLVNLSKMKTMPLVLKATATVLLEG